jgi:DNA-directed RNA polymerase specialized sigma24 family protein
MPNTISAKKEWELTSEAFSKFLTKLAPTLEKGGEKYEELRHQLIKLFEWRGSHIADELADETLNRVVRKIDEGEELEKNVTALAVGIAHYVFLESLKRPDNNRAEMKESFYLAMPSELRDEDDDLWLNCLRECMHSLSEENRQLIIEYYQREKRAKIDHRRRLAAELNLSPNTLISRARRIRDKLKQCVTQCLERKLTGAT